MATLKTSTAHNHLIHVFGEEGALVKMKECGFDGVDFSFDHWQLDYDYFLLQDEDTLKKFCARQKEVCDRIGLAVAHTHAPYYFCDPKHYDNPDFVERFINAIKATKYLGSNFIVIHPTYYPDPENNFERSIEINTKFYKRLKPYALDLGVTVAIENLCAVHPITRKGVPSSNCSAEKLSRLIDGLGEGFCACFDTGHAFFCGQNPATQLRLLGDRVKVLHLHDNDGSDDWHLIPGFGKIDWEDVLKALKEINFSGYINTEVNFLRTGREQTIIQHATLVERVSRDFINRIEKM